MTTTLVHKQLVHKQAIFLERITCPRWKKKVYAGYNASKLLQQGTRGRAKDDGIGIVLKCGTRAKTQASCCMRVDV